MRFIYLFSLFIAFILCKSTILLGQIDSTNLPLFIIDTNGGRIIDEPKIPADLKIIYKESEYNHLEDTANVYDGNIGIEIRGRYSASLPQKPFGLETRDSLHENNNIPLFHMPKENDWILLANFNDKTFMRNSLAFKLFRDMGHYAPRTQFCEVILNDTYEGIYVFTEKIKRDSGRVDIATLTPEENSGDEVTGGYIFKIDYYDDTNSWPSSYSPIGQSDKKVHFVYHYPKPDEITYEQKVYILNFLEDFERTLYTTNRHLILEALSEYMDIGSFIDYFIVNELARNVDGYKKSSYFHKDKDSKGGLLHAGPIWDFDWAWKNINECYFGALDGSGWAFRIQDCDPWPVPPSWMTRLLQNPSFKQKVFERYFDLRNSTLSEGSLFNYIDSVASLLDEAQGRHYRRWPILGINVGTPETDSQPTTFAGEIDKFKNWIATRLNWLDANIVSFEVTGLDEPDIQSGKPADFLLFPNPAISQLSLQSDKNITSITIFSTSGQVMISKPGLNTNLMNVDITALPPGLYMAKLSFNDGSLIGSKFVKEK